MKFLFTAWPYSGHIHPCIALARALQSRGHEVAFYSGAAARGVVEQANFACFPFRALAENVAALTGDSDPSDHPELSARLTERYTSLDEKNPLRRWRRVQAMYDEMIVGTVPAQVTDLTLLLAQWQPDVVISDPFMWGPALILREKQRVPVVVFSFFAGCMLPGPDAPPHGFGLPRARNWRTRARNGLAASVAYRAASSVRRAANAVRRQHGLPPIAGTYLELVGRLPLHLVASSPEYDYERRDLPASVHYVGPCLYDPPCPPSSQMWVKRLTPGRPVVYVSEGTCQVRDPVVLRAAAQGLAELPIDVVMTTGRQRDARSLALGPLALNIILESWVSHGELFPKCRAIVTNGGSGTVRAALAAGVPLVVVPMEWDQLENAQRVVECGAGLRLSPGQCDARRLRGAVEMVLQEPSFARNAARIGASFARYGGGEEAAQFLENLCSLPARAEPSPAGRCV